MSRRRGRSPCCNGQALILGGRILKLTAAEIRALNGAPDLESPVQKRRKRLVWKKRRTAQILFVAGALAFFLHSLIKGPWNFGY